MRRALLTLLLCAVALIWAAPVQAGFDTPWHIAGPVDRAKDAVMPDRCPVLGNPIECVDWTDHDGGRDHGHAPHTPTHRHRGSEGRGRDAQCASDRRAYMYQHPTHGPRTCAVYAEDRAYHGRMTRIGVDVDTQAGIEDFVSALRSWFDGL